VYPALAITTAAAANAATAAALPRPLPARRQDACQDMLKCFGLELHSEKDALLEAQRFSGPTQSVYVLNFYQPP
jgi:hypothetical protein